VVQSLSRTPASIATARELMERFAVRTGLQGGGAPRRYLWTDAFATCNALALWEATGDGRALRFAYALVDQVHEVLGRHRPRTSWT
jgi:hypothetical protein